MTRRSGLWALVPVLAAVFILFPSILFAAPSVQWKSLPGTLRSTVAYNKLGELVDTRVNIGIRYTNAGDKTIAEIYDRHAWYEGVIEVTPKNGTAYTLEFKYDEEYPGSFEADLKPGESRTRNYVILLAADRVVKDYDLSAKYKVKELRAVKHTFRVKEK